MKKTLIGFGMATILFFGIAASTLQRGEVTTSRFLRGVMTNETAAEFRSAIGVDSSGVTYDLSVSSNLPFSGFSDGAKTEITNAADVSAKNATNKFKSDVAAGTVPVAGAAITGSVPGTALGNSQPLIVDQLKRGTNTVVGTNFVGNAAGLTNLQASELSGVISGTVTGTADIDITGSAATATNAIWVAQAVTNQWRSDAAETTNKLKSDIGAGLVPLLASALIGSSPGLQITNGGWIIRAATNLFSQTSNSTFYIIPQTPGATPGGGWRLAIGGADGDKDFLDFWMNTRHDSNTPNLRGSELQIGVGGSIALSPGYGAGVIKHFQKGIGGANPRVPGAATMNYWSYAQFIAPFDYEPGYTWADTYKLVLNSGTYYPGLIGRCYTNTAGFGQWYELSMLADLRVDFLPSGDGTYSYDVWSISNVVSGAGYYKYTSGALEGLYHRGAFLQSQTTDSASASTNITLDFGKSASIVIDAPVGAWRFVTTNSLGYSSNYQRMVFLFPATGIPVTNIAYNTSWRMPTNVYLPTEIPGTNYFRLEVESFGFGETNKVLVSATTGIDPAFYWDADALDWFSRATITNALDMGVINIAVKEMKRDNVWTNLAFIYVPLQNVAAFNGENLKGNTFDVSWTSAVHTNDGVGFNGTTSFGDTTFNPTSSGYYSQNSAFLAVWSGTPSLANFSVTIGAMSGSTERGYLLINGNPGLAGLNNNTGAASASSADHTGLWIGNRTGSTVQNFSLRGNYTEDLAGIPTSGNVNANIYLGARNSGGAGNFASMNMRMAAGGAGMDSTKLTAFKAIWNKVGRYKGWPGAQ